MVLHELYRSKEIRDAALASGAYDGMGESSHREAPGEHRIVFIQTLKTLHHRS